MTIREPALRYLCLSSKSYLDLSTDMWWTRLVGDRTVWGYDLEGWNNARSMDDNLRHRFGDLRDFDAVFLSNSFTFGDCHGKTWAAPTLAMLGDRPAVSFIHELVDVQQYDPERRRWPRCNFYDVDIVLHAYSEAELDCYYRQRERGRLGHFWSKFPRLGSQYFAHIPHHVRTDIFSPPPVGVAGRDIEVLLVGRHHADLYPLRARWARLIRAGHWKSAVHVEPPHGMLCEWKDAKMEKQQRDYADHLRRARIVLSCSSHWRYMLQKFTEIAASGAFLVSDVPSGAPSEYIEHMGVVSNTMTDAQLVAIVNGWLGDTTGREQRAARLAASQRERWSVAGFWKQVDAAVRSWREERALLGSHDEVRA